MNTFQGQGPTLLKDQAEQLVARSVLAGDEAAFEELVRRYSPLLFNFIYHLIHNYDQACDILQNVFIRLYTSFPTLDLSRPLKPWLFQVAHNCCIDEIRTKKKNQVYFSQFEQEQEDEKSGGPYDIPDDAPAVDELAERHEMAEQLQEAISHLPSAYRSIVLLRYISQFRFREIAAVTGIPEATVKTYFHRAKGRLRVLLEKSGAYTQAQV